MNKTQKTKKANSINEYSCDECPYKSTYHKGLRTHREHHAKIDRVPANKKKCKFCNFVIGKAFIGRHEKLHLDSLREKFFPTSKFLKPQRRFSIGNFNPKIRIANKRRKTLINPKSVAIRSNLALEQRSTVKETTLHNSQSENLTSSLNNGFVSKKEIEVGYF